MSLPSPLTVKPHGIVLDTRPEDVPADHWTGGRNVTFRNGETLRVRGMAKFAETGRLFAATFVHYVDLGNQEWWIYGGDAGIAAYNGTTHFNITPTGWGAIASKNKVYTVGDINTVPFVNHPERGPFWWDGDPSHKFVTLPDWPVGQSCDVMRAHKNFLVAMAINSDAGNLEMVAQWSSSADPGQVPEFWVPDPENDAGEFTFASPGGPLIDVISVRDQFFISKESATYVGQYVGGTFVFQQRDIFPSVGLFATGACVEHGNFVYQVTGAGEIIRHDGTTVQNLLYGVMQDYFSKALNHEYPSGVFMCRDLVDGHIYVCYPTGTSKTATEAIVIEIASIGRGNMVDASIVDLPGVSGCAVGFTSILDDTWDAAVGSWDTDPLLWNEQASGYRPAHLVLAAGSLLEKGVGVTMDGVPINAFVERAGMEFSTFDKHKTISQGFPRLEGADGQTLQFQFGGQEQVRDPVEWLPQMPFVLGTDYALDFYLDSRLVSFQMSSAGGDPWRFSGLMLTGRTSGKWGMA